MVDRRTARTGSLVVVLVLLAVSLLAIPPGAAGQARLPVLGASGPSTTALPPAHSTTPREGSCSGVRLTWTSSCQEMAVRGAGFPLAGGTPGWTEVSSSPPPQNLDGFEMTFDAADGYVLLLGTIAGSGAGGPGTSDLWSYARGNWTELHPAILPQNCRGSSLAYDDHDGYVVYFGGMQQGGGTPPCSSANQTWSYRAGLWTQLHPTTSPPGRTFAAMTNDSADGYLLLFGGESPLCTPYGWCGGTWAFANGNWSALAPSVSPSNRGESGMAYDAADGYVLLFGGANSTGFQNDTWKFLGGNWTLLHPTVSPPAPAPDAFNYNSADKAVVYTTAYNWSGTRPEETWTYAAGNWTRVTSSGPVQRLGLGGADDPPDGYALFFGGEGYVPYSDTWSLKAATWTNRTPPSPVSRYYAASAYDASTSLLTLFGGISYGGGCCAFALNDTWTFDGLRWTQPSLANAPPARDGASLVYDAHDGYLLLYGGSGSTGILNDTWEYTGGAWTELTPTTSPPSGNFWSRAVYDGADGYVLLVVGSGGHTWTWTYSAGVWTNRTASVGTAPGAPADTLAYDSTDGIVLLFGTSTPAGLTNQTWTFHGGHWTNVTGSTGGAPPVPSGAALADYPPGGYVFLQGADDQNDTWAYSNGSWTELSVPPGPSTRFGAAAAYDPAISADVFFGGSSSQCQSGSSTACGDTWLWSDSGPAVPFIHSFAAHPPVTDVGNRTYLLVGASGGVGPLTYSYTGLPPGCASANVSSLGCVPSVAGSYQVQVSVTDSAGHLAAAVTSLSVNSLLSVPSLTVSPNPVTLGGTMVLRATASGGSSPYSYAYTGLPLGCSSQTIPALPCTPNSSGTWLVQVNVGDAVGQSANASVSVTVAPAGATGAPQISAFGAYPAALVLGNSTNLSVTASGPTLPLSYAYAGLPAGCASANTTRLTCSPINSGEFSIVVTVGDPAGGSVAVGTNLTVYPVGGGAGLTLSAFGAAPGVIALGDSTVLAVVASGGIGPLGYAYSGLPGGCAPANSSVIPCAPTSVGNFTLQGSAFDSAGHRVAAQARLQVLPPGAGPAPSITLFLATPANVTLGGALTITVSTGGGTPPLSYSYSGLPPGCTNADAAVLTCVPTTTGNFTPTVRVADAYGRSTDAHTTVTVVPARPGPGGSENQSSLGLLASPAVIAAAAVAGILTGLGIVAVVERRRRRRQEAEQFVRALESSSFQEPPEEPGA